MSLKYHEGFDYQAEAADMARLTDPVAWSAGEACSFVTGRDDTGRALSTDAVVSATLGTQQASQFVGFAWRLDGDCTLTIGESTSGEAQLVITFGADSHNVTISCGETTLKTSAGGIWNAGEWYFIEVWPVISDSDGSVELRLDGGKTLDLALTGVVTQASDNAYWDTLCWDGSESGGTAPIDDFYWCDAASGDGAVDCISLLGDCRTVTFFPVGNDAVAWTPATCTDILPLAASGAANWQQVCESAMDGDASANVTSVSGAADIFNFAPLEQNIDVIFALSTVITAKGNGNGTASLTCRIVSGDGVSVSESYTPPLSDYISCHTLFLSDPATDGLFTLKRFNRIRAGYQLV